MGFAYVKSLALHAAVAERLRVDPALVERARAKLETWIARGGRSVPPLFEWRPLLDGPLDTLLAFLTERTERAAQLRSCSPFAGFLDPRERERILREVRRRHEAA